MTIHFRKYFAPIIIWSAKGGIVSVPAKFSYFVYLVRGAFIYQTYTAVGRR